MGKKLNILSICGSGVVTSSMVANKLIDIFSDLGYEVKATEANPSEVENYVMRDQYDLIAYASPLIDSFGVPALSAMGLVTGMGEEEFVEAALKIFKEHGK
jgi:PTS system galactitol-specific IIB component